MTTDLFLRLFNLDTACVPSPFGVLSAPPSAAGAPSSARPSSPWQLALSCHWPGVRRRSYRSQRLSCFCSSASVCSTSRTLLLRSPSASRRRAAFKFSSSSLRSSFETSSRTLTQGVYIVGHDAEAIGTGLQSARPLLKCVDL